MYLKYILGITLIIQGYCSIVFPTEDTPNQLIQIVYIRKNAKVELSEVQKLKEKYQNVLPQESQGGLLIKNIKSNVNLAIKNSKNIKNCPNYRLDNTIPPLIIVFDQSQGDKDQKTLCKVNDSTMMIIIDNLSEKAKKSINDVVLLSFGPMYKKLFEEKYGQIQMTNQDDLNNNKSNNNKNNHTHNNNSNKNDKQYEFDLGFLVDISKYKKQN